MSCGIDKIIEESKATLNETIERLIEDLATDFNLQMDVDEVKNQEATAILRGELQKYAVWLVHDRHK
ncbi:hypothetical protein [Magnetococcus marinus]|uniref:hypothetical protein n=1 Tax=Magnetococcus marinus TaxID=1124597 RepID=UPI0002FB531B|nr:hypothetical protein [Magnetococcus marinus]